MRNIGTAAAVAALFAACGGSRSGTAPTGAQEVQFGLIDLIDHSPTDHSVQVPVDADLRLVFDAPIALDSLGDVDTWLRRGGSEENVPGSYAVETGGLAVVFTPASALAIETDYTYQLSGLTCDDQGRLLDRTVRFTFRTLDESPPVLLGVDVSEGETARSRNGAFTFRFNEAVDPTTLDTATLSLRDAFGFTYAGARRTIENTVVFEPYADLPGSRAFTLTLTGDIADRAGNPLGATSATHFTTAGDSDRPSVLTRWPDPGSSGVSPVVQPTYTFSESMDPGTVEPASLRFEDQFGSVVPFAIHPSDDQRTLRVEPTIDLQSDRAYTLTFVLGAAATTDVSGNTLEETMALQFVTGNDHEPPVLLESTPAPDEERVSINAILELHFDEALDAAWISEDTVRLLVEEQELAAVVEHTAPDTIRITPVLLLPPGSECRVNLQGGHEGLHDDAGNVMVTDLEFSFRTTGDEVLPRALIAPAEGASGVPIGAHVSVVFDAPMDPTTMNGSTILVTDDNGTPIAGALEIAGRNRIARFVPNEQFAASTFYRVQVKGGSAGVRRTSGSWFSSDRSARFRTGTGRDLLPPIVRATVNGIDSSRATGLVLPPHGFTIDVSLADPGDQSHDISSVEIQLSGTAGGPDAEALFAAAVVSPTTFRVTVPASDPLGIGDWSMSVRATDLSGNTTVSNPMTFAVAEATSGLVPFERVQVVWVRSDLDRDGTGEPDLAEDMLRLGLGTEGDPLGANARLREIVLDGVITRANELYGRGSRGEPIDSGSVWLRFTKRSPIAIPHAQIALGGFDPEGPRGRGYGDESTGVLGRAIYDFRNGNVADRNTSSSPGLGVFPGEIWLHQTHLHLETWPAHMTVFAERFRPLAPAMGGVPAGAGPLDPTVLAENFDYATAPSNQRARWLSIMQAADDWAVVVGTVLAHEIGHSVGLVAPGPAPGGLFGDSSLHNTYAGIAEVMAASVGYEAMLTLEYRFRDTDLAYLRQRILVR